MTTTHNFLRQYRQAWLAGLTTVAGRILFGLGVGCLAFAAGMMILLLLGVI